MQKHTYFVENIFLAVTVDMFKYVYICFTRLSFT